MSAAVIYAAKSTEDRHGSIPTQLEDCRRLAEREGWEVVGEFSDEAFSAYHGNRGPGLEHAKTAAIAAAPCVLIAQDVDRFARGAGDAPGAADHLGEMFFAMRRQRVALWSCRTGEVDSIRAVIEGERGHSESERKSQAVTAGMRRRAAERGKLSGGPRPLGYRWVARLVEGRSVSDLEQVPAEVPVVRRIFEDSVNGASQRALALALTTEDVPTVQGGEWRQASIRRVLENPLYKGYVRHSGEVFKGAHEPIVDEELWDAAKALRESKARTIGHGGGRWPKGHHLLTKGLLKCGSCGSSMIPRTDESRKGAGEWYVCDGRQRRGKRFCSQGFVRRAGVDEAILSELSRRWLDLEEMRRRLRAKLAHDADAAEQALGQAQADAQRARERLTRVQRGYQDGVLDDDDYREQREQLLAEREAAEAAVGRVEDRIARVQEVRPLDAEEAVLRQLASLRAAVVGKLDAAPDLNALRRLLGDLFSEVRYVETDDGMRLCLRGRIPGSWGFERVAGTDYEAPRRAVLALEEELTPEGFVT